VILKGKTKTKTQLLEVGEIVFIFWGCSYHLYLFIFFLRPFLRPLYFFEVMRPFKEGRPVTPQQQNEGNDRLRCCVASSH